jgi:DNA-binding MarR family transcriptional regulator
LIVEIYDNGSIVRDRAALVWAVMAGVVRFQQATDAVDETAAERLGVNRTDLRCLGSVSERESLSAGELAEAAGLSRGATTTAIDRLERAGYVRRVRDDRDRRSVRVEATPLARARIAELYDPIGRAGRAALEAYDEAQLTLLADFLRRGHALQREHALRIRSAAPPAAEPRGRRAPGPRRPR